MIKFRFTMPEREIRFREIPSSIKDHRRNQPGAVLVEFEVPVGPFVPLLWWERILRDQPDGLSLVGQRILVRVYRPNNEIVYGLFPNDGQQLQYVPLGKTKELRPGWHEVILMTDRLQAIMTDVNDPLREVLEPFFGRNV